MAVEVNDIAPLVERPGIDGVLIAAHELKEPLTILRQLALSFSELDIADEQIRTQMIDVSERALRQVNDLAKLRRLEDGLFVMEPVVIREVCEAAAHELNNLAEASGRTLRIKYINRSRLVTANRELLFSVIYNFLLSAIHYSHPDARAELLVRDTHNRVRVSVRDFGASLPISVWRAIQSGRVGHPTAIAMRPGSSGLGLYVASRFSHYMNASVGAVRHRDGTSFYVELPISRQASLF